MQKDQTKMALQMRNSSGVNMFLKFIHVVDSNADVDEESLPLNCISHKF